MPSQFSSDGQYFAFLSTEGKLKIWNAVTGSFEQEYSPDYHLSCPCTCLQFINSHSSSYKWNCGNDKITAIKEIPGNKLIAASKIIRLVDISSKEIIRSFTGHSSNVCLLEYVCPKADSDAYFISGSVNDWLLNCWTLNDSNPEKNAIASFLMDDIAQSVSVVVGSDSTTNMAALTRGGLVHIYQHMLNGKRNKPLKPKTTIQIASDTGQNVFPIPIMGAQFQKDLSLLICHGSSILLTFENITINTHEKLQCLVRSDLQTLKAAKQTESSKFRSPLVNNSVQYLTPHTITSSTSKRKPDGGSQEIPMEQRLENLTLTKTDITSKVPKVDNVAQLLVQGLHSKDKHILKSVLIRRDENVIRSTIRRLPMPVIVPLLQELTSYIQGKTAMSSTGSLWLKHLLQVHTALLLSNPQLSELLDPVLGSIQSRLLLQTPLSKLSGRLDLLMAQINRVNTQENNETDEALLSYIDKDSSDSENENMIQVQSESENEWTEDESEDNENSGNSEKQEDDSEMST
ncbi:wd repeat-containing protein 43 [Holotrichia oblita]|uniref:Wd repeat-containing protein 43 n=1 Tax=Holotrichia oblita TaxID=644536 RepID=A0ACB9TXC3_HOLOL|nr:wd repeat-containing protein 43 [Holotrichia oblita]